MICFDCLSVTVPAALPAESCQSEQPHVPAAEATGMTTPVMGAKRSRRRRARTNYTPEQLEGLEKLFSDNHYPGIDDRETLSDSIDLSEARIQVCLKLHHNFEKSNSFFPKYEGAKRNS